MAPYQYPGWSQYPYNHQTGTPTTPYIYRNPVQSGYVPTDPYGFKNQMHNTYRTHPQPPPGYTLLDPYGVKNKTSGYVPPNPYGLNTPYNTTTPYVASTSNQQLPITAVMMNQYQQYSTSTQYKSQISRYPNHNRSQVQVNETLQNDDNEEEIPARPESRAQSLSPSTHERHPEILIPSTNRIPTRKLKSILKKPTPILTQTHSRSYTYDPSSPPDHTNLYPRPLAWRAGFPNRRKNKKYFSNFRLPSLNLSKLGLCKRLKIELNDILQYSPHQKFILDYDLRFHPNTTSSILTNTISPNSLYHQNSHPTPNTTYPHISGFSIPGNNKSNPIDTDNEFATYPPIPVLTIWHEKLPWKINIKATVEKIGVTIWDILNQLYTFLDITLKLDEYFNQELKEWEREELAVAYGLRVKVVSYEKDIKVNGHGRVNPFTGDIGNVGNFGIGVTGPPHLINGKSNHRVRLTGVKRVDFLHEQVRMVGLVGPGKDGSYEIKTISSSHCGFVPAIP